MDGDAFRKCEAEVVNHNDDNCFVLGLHALGDARQVSEYCGMFWVGAGVLVRAHQARGRVNSFLAVGDWLLTRRLSSCSVHRLYFWLYYAI